MSLLESFHSSASIYYLLGAGIEGVAVGTDVNANFRHCRAGNPFMAAGTLDLGFWIILGMDVVFHT